MSIGGKIRSVWEDGLTLGKVILQSRRPTPGIRNHAGSIVVMGNGPSLTGVLEKERDTLMSMDRMAVNFAANSDIFPEIAPQYYILADPHFFNGADADSNVARLWERLSAVTWPMTLWLPIRFRKEAMSMADNLPCNVNIKWFNLTPSEGGGILTRKLISAGLAMPRPRNVLIPAIMCALREGYKEIVLIGADHSWLQSLWVDDENRVVSVQPHFYKDNKNELDRVAAAYAGYHLHDILGSMVVAFRSYFEIAEYARRHGVRIINSTPGSFIDAFERRAFSQKQKL